MVAPERSLRADAQRNRDAVLDTASRLFAERGDAVQMDEIAERAGLGVGTVYRHFADKRALLAAIVGRRFAAATELARSAEQLRDPWAAFEALLNGYLETAQEDAAFRRAILGPEEPDWDEVAAQKSEFSSIVARIVARAVDAGRVRRDFTHEDFILLTRGAIANMNGADWHRYLTLLTEGLAVDR